MHEDLNFERHILNFKGHAFKFGISKQITQYVFNHQLCFSPGHKKNVARTSDLSELNVLIFGCAIGALPIAWLDCCGGFVVGRSHVTSEILPFSAEPYRSSIILGYQKLYAPKLVCFDIPERFYKGNFPGGATLPLNQDISY